MVVINRAMETARLRRENSSLRRGGDRVADMLGQSAAFKRLRDALDKVARSNGRVMLAGEPGTGRRAPRAISTRTARARRRLSSPSPCHDRARAHGGGAVRPRIPERGIEPGLLEQAHGGIIYFDEVGDMPMGTQPKILRVLTEQQFVRAGGADKVRVDLRVLSSTNRDLVAEIAAGRFRQELFDRLNVVPIAVPSLADRRDDIAALARHFIEQFHKNQGLTPRDLPEETVAALQSMRWPGNIRQLRNVIERVLILAESHGPILPSELEPQGPRRTTATR
ncbi:sigma 54-interacting transcriptional regulator [Paracoccus marcusii]|uniref:sigma-54-dependent transcriptional regulator n=1 Tax=Paracoccus marcusii TaxID=59779 RepID=UPI002ED16478|nr:sigma 54-interacting transcriptional regulator [Paracoccus marcusii]